MVISKYHRNRRDYNVFGKYVCPLYSLHCICVHVLSVAEKQHTWLDTFDSDIYNVILSAFYILVSTFPRAQQKVTRPPPHSRNKLISLKKNIK